MGKSIRILLVDDHAILRQGIRALLEGHDGFEVVGEAENGRDAVRKAQDLSPDVVVMDIAMPVLNGLEATRRITKMLPHTKVLALTMYGGEEYVFQILKAGASGYLTKDTAAEDLVNAILSVHDGTPYFSPAISRKIMESYLKDDEDKTSRGEADKLTNREKEVLQLIAEGYTNNKIAGLMGISVKTVETHRAHIMSKLNIHDLAGLIKYAIKKGIVVVEMGR